MRVPDRRWAAAGLVVLAMACGLGAWWWPSVEDGAVAAGTEVRGRREARSPRRPRVPAPELPAAEPAPDGFQVPEGHPALPSEDGLLEARITVRDPRESGRVRLFGASCPALVEQVPLDRKGSLTTFAAWLDPERPCTLQAWRMDGALRAWSGSVALDLSQDGPITAVLVLPDERTGGLGVGIEAGPRGIVVGQVHPMTPAGRVGLQPGDVIVEVDGLPSEALTLEEFQQVMTGPEGTEVTFVIERGGSDTGGGRQEAFTIERAALRMDHDLGAVRPFRDDED